MNGDQTGILSKCVLSNLQRFLFTLHIIQHIWPILWMYRVVDTKWKILISPLTVISTSPVNLAPVTCCFITPFSHLTDSRQNSAIDSWCHLQRPFLFACWQDTLVATSKGCEEESTLITPHTRKRKFYLVGKISREYVFEHSGLVG